MARDGSTGQPLADAADPADRPALRALNAGLEGRTEKLRNPHDESQLAWYARIARLAAGLAVLPVDTARRAPKPCIPLRQRNLYSCTSGPVLKRVQISLPSPKSSTRRGDLPHPGVVVQTRQAHLPEVGARRATSQERPPHASYSPGVVPEPVVTAKTPIDFGTAASRRRMTHNRRDDRRCRLRPGESKTLRCKCSANSNSSEEAH
jgi:hypothetical protein